MKTAHHPALIPTLYVGVIVVAFASLNLGAMAIAPAQFLDAVIGRGDPITDIILFELRLPRTIIALLVGGILGLSGAVLQGYLRNPLAEPSVLGASNAAALGAVGAIYFGLAVTNPILLPVLSIVSSLLCLALLFALAGRSDSPLTLILAGIAISTLGGAGISLALNLSPNPFAAMEIMSWLMGSIENRSTLHVWMLIPCVVLGALLLLWDGRALDALSLGEDGAQSLGVDLAATRVRILFGVAIGVGGAVAVSGAIGFVGLIVPHLLRPFTDRSPSSLLFPSILGGAILLTAADILVRIISLSNELKLGVITAFLGVPIFLMHLIRDRNQW